MAKRVGIVDQGIEIELSEIFARVARVVYRNQVRAAVEAVLDPANRAREGAPAVGECDSQPRQRESVCGPGRREPAT